METNFKEVEFRPYNPDNNDCTCVDGELEGWGALAMPGIEPVFTIEAGEVLAMHQCRAIIYHEGRLMWGSPGESAHIATDDLVEIAAMPRPISVAMLGDTLITAGDSGLLYHRWIGSTYSSLPQLPAMPKIEFGLLKQGEMADKCEIIIPASMAPAAPGGNGMSDPHPSANTASDISVSEGIDKIFDVFIKNAHDDKRNRGYFTSPFFVRFAVRDRQDCCLCVSPPVLMAGNVLPPCMNVQYTFKTETESTMYSQLTASPYFSLMMRACPLPEEWVGVVKSIDVYVSPQIPTYTATRGYLCRYATLLKEVNVGGWRGRENPGSGDGVFAGHYSDDGVSYTDHYADESLRDETVWYVAPNAALASDITSESRYYRIASFDADSLRGMSQFISIGGKSTVTAMLEKRERLADDQPVALYPAALAVLNGRLVAGGGWRAPLLPADPAVAVAFSGDVSAVAAKTVTVSVYTRDGGELRRLSVTCGSVADFADCFPRYIYHPDSAATLMTIESGGEVYRLPLTAHPVMPGVYWFGGLAYGCRPEADVGALPAATDGGHIACADHVWLSSLGSPHHFTQSQGLAACNSGVIAVVASVVTPDISAVGRYPVYIFADDGVWLAEYDSDRLRLCGSYRISSEVCISGRSVAVTDDGVVFATERSLMMAAGSKVKRLMPLPGISVPPLPVLPGLSGLSEVSGNIPSGRPLLAFDGVTFSLIIADSDSGTAFICDMKTLAVSLWDTRVVSLPLTAGRALIQTTINEAGYLLPQTAAASGSLILTRPIKLSKAFTPKVLRSVTVWHSGVPDCISVKVFAANSFASWHLIASSACHRAEIAGRSPWRFVRIAVTARSSTEIYGAQIEWSG